MFTEDISIQCLFKLVAVIYTIYTHAYIRTPTHTLKLTLTHVCVYAHAYTYAQWPSYNVCENTVCNAHCAHSLRVCFSSSSYAQRATSNFTKYFSSTIRRTIYHHIIIGKYMRAYLKIAIPL